MLIATAMAVVFAATAHAGGNYPMLLCAGNNGSNSFATATNTTSPQNPGGIFSFENYCGPAPDPAGNNAFLRIAENQGGGNAGVNAYGSISWTATPWVAIVAGGGYTREPNAFNDGWRGRFWAEDFGGGGHNILMQGSGVANGSLGGIGWGTTSTFASHLWPFGGYGDYRRFIFELTCMRPAGCDRANFNAVDANTIHLTLADRQDPSVSFVGGATVNGSWVRGEQAISWHESDQGSGLRFSRLKVDGHTLGDGTIDYHANGGCDVGWSGASGEFARRFNPCTGGPYQRWYGLKTQNFSDGQHGLGICIQDYGNYRSGGETCDNRTIRTDNTAPGAPADLQVTSANPERYLPSFGAKWTLPPDQGSPITKVHYEVRNAAGDVVKPAKTVSATNPTALSAIEGPSTPGAYTLRVWLTDQVGHVGAAASAPIPHDTKPPAAPQALQVAAPGTPRSAEGFDLRWRNIVDAGSPIDAAHYRIEAGGGVAVPAKTRGGENPQAVQSIEAPDDRGSFTLRLWLTDAEGNVGAPVTAPLSYECVRSAVGGAGQLTASLGGEPERQVAQGQGATLSGELRGQGGDIAGAPLCVFEQVEGEAARRFLGIAITGSGGDYRFAIGAGPNRTIRALYRPGQRRLAAEATLRTQVKPSLEARKRVVRTGEAAHLYGQIPGPRNDEVVVVLQVHQGEGWLAFRRYRTRGGGRFEADYLFRRTSKPTTYEFRAQVRESGGYPYVEGDSDPLYLRVLPKRAKAAGRCPKGRRWAKKPGRGKARCVAKRAAIHKRCARARRAARRHPGAKSMRRRANRLCARSKRVRRAERRGHSGGKGGTHRQGRR
ncbi:MAG TPA: fibronectin type III domain-containing protein [Solirubrobacterales bacterium]|nr:fibronectin type III domain-containing protein [Solirubrobacterales bacterium]